VQKKKVAIVCIDAHGEIHPTLELVRTLVGNGHAVDYLVPEIFSQPGRLSKLIEGLGARHLTCSAAFMGPTPETPPPNTMIGHSRRRMVEAAVGILPFLLEYCATEKPDVLLYNRLCLTAIVCARRYRIPSAMLHPTYCGSMNWMLEFGDRSVEQEALGQYVAFLRESYPEAPRSLDALLAEHDSCNIVFMAREFHPHGAQFDGHYHFVGAQMPPNAGSTAEPAKVVYVSLGTKFARNNFPFFARCVEAFAESEHEIIMSISYDIAVEDFGTLPRNVRIFQYTDQLEILRHTAAFVTHGGMNSIQEAISHRVPMVVVPQAFDQMYNAKRVAELGCGIVLPGGTKDATSSGIAAAVSEIAHSPAMLENLARERNHSKAGGGAERTAEIVMSLSSP